MSVHRIITALVFTLFAPLQAQADDWCEELWILRNMAFDRSGYCLAALSAAPCSTMMAAPEM